MCKLEEMPPGLRWRIELVEEILEKKQWNKKGLMNIAKGYVPAVFEYHRYPSLSDRLKWLPSFRGDHIMGNTSYNWVKEEIKNIGYEFSVLPKLNDKTAKKVLMKNGWSTGKDARVIGCTNDKRIAWRYDGIKKRVAVEVELSSRPAIFKQCFKFLIGQGLDQIDLGVIMVRQHKIGSEPNLDSVDHDITRVYDALPMLAVVISGF